MFENKYYKINNNNKKIRHIIFMQAINRKNHYFCCSKYKLNQNRNEPSR